MCCVTNSNREMLQNLLDFCSELYVNLLHFLFLLILVKLLPAQA